MKKTPAYTKGKCFRTYTKGKESKAEFSTLPIKITWGLFKYFNSYLAHQTNYSASWSKNQKL
jgi:hypothetical protein